VPGDRKPFKNIGYLSSGYQYVQISEGCRINPAANTNSHKSGLTNRDSRIG